MSAGEIAGRFDISRPAVSRHLRVLRECGLVVDEVRGRERLYQLDTAPLAPLEAGWPSCTIAGRARWMRSRRRCIAHVASVVVPVLSPATKPHESAPGGRLVRTAEGLDLVIVRKFNAPIEDVWASITEPERTARWWGPWTGEPGPGRTISYKMAFEGEGPASEMLIEACEPPRHLAVRLGRITGGGWKRI